MKQNVHPAVVAAALVIILGVVVYFGYKAVNPGRIPSPTAEEMVVLQQKHDQQKAEQMKQMQNKGINAHP